MTRREEAAGASRWGLGSENRPSRRWALNTGALRLAKELGPGHTIVTILCDVGTRYLSKLYNRDFLKSKDLPVPDFLP